jgi:hypothetical protein
MITEFSANFFYGIARSGKKMDAIANPIARVLRLNKTINEGRVLILRRFTHKKFLHHFCSLTGCQEDSFWGEILMK